MALVSVTRLRLRAVQFFPWFAYHAMRSTRQARRARGNQGVIVRKTAGFTFWTLTVWDSEADMAAFRREPPHRNAMRKLRDWCDEAAYARWEQADATLPDWIEAARRLRDTGHLSHVLHPSPEQQAGRIAIT